MVNTIFHHIRASWKESASVRQIADLTDQQFADIGGQRLDSRLLEKSVGVFSYPTA
jgi:hypothetical protein